MSRYSVITIIYNPKSTGQGKRMARECKARLKETLPHQKVSLVGTRYAGHAERIAYQQAMGTRRALIVSVSGDGGYHEVVNGVMKARLEGAKAVVGLLPAGNANDHYRSLHQQKKIDLVGHIAAGQERRIDLLTLTAQRHGRPFVRYAHSYIGLGLTPKAGRDLNRTRLNRFNEIWIVLRAILRLKPVRLIVEGKIRRYDSLIFSNIGRMSKAISLSDAAQLDDGKFEVVSMPRRHKLYLLRHLLQASTIGLKVHRQRSEYMFHTIRPTLVQLDGEVYRIDGRCKVEIQLQHRALECIGRP